MSEYFPPSMPDDPPRSADNSWLRTAVGGLLVLLGVELLIQRAIGRDIHLLLPAIGLAFLAGWFRNQRRGYLIAGGIIVGWGTGLMFNSLLGRSFGFLAPLGLACGFLLIQRLSADDESWARIAFIISGVVALAEFGSVIGLNGAITNALGTIAAPMALIILGGLVVSRRVLPRRAFAIGAASAACFGLIALNASASELSFSLGSARASRQVSADLPSIEGRTLVLEAGLGDVTVVTGAPMVTAEVTSRARDQAAARSRVRSARLVVDEDTEARTVTVRLVARDYSGASYRLAAPAGSAVEIRSGSGDVSGSLDGGDATILSGSGDIELTVIEPDNLTVRTGSGDVDLTVHGDPDVDLRSGSGDVDTNGFDDRPRWGERHFITSGTDGKVLITTGSGDIDAEREGR